MSKEAMKLALEALRKARRKVLTTEECHAVIMSIKEALAEQKSGIKQVIELYDSPDQPAQQEPVAKYSDIVSDGGLDPRNTTPPQRTWVGLTDQEFQWIYDHGRTSAGMMELVEAKLKEKNT